MPVTIIATAGASNANSYATEAQARAYNDAHVSGETYTDADSDAQKRALVTATRMLDANVRFVGVATSLTQVLQFPRTGLVDPVTGLAVDAAIVPVQVREACAEFARLLLVNDPTKPSDVEIAGLASLKAGDVELAFRDATSSAAAASRAVVPPSVIALLKPYIDPTASTALARKLTRV